MTTIKLPLQFFVTSNLYQFTLDQFFYTNARKDVNTLIILLLKLFDIKSTYRQKISL